MKKKHLLFAALLTVTISACGCSINKTTNSSKESNVNLIVGRNFFASKSYGGNVAIGQGDSVGDILEKNFDVQTASAGYVKSIDGVGADDSNKTKNAWFYFVNGIASDSAANAYKLKPKDKVEWDYHSWDSDSFTPAIIGAYPEPFVSGFAGKTKGVNIYYTKESKQEAIELKNALASKGASNIKAEQMSNDFKIVEGYPSIVIGEWAEIQKNKQVMDFFTQSNKKGIFAKFNKNGVELLDYKGSVKKTCDENTAVLAATASNMGDGSPLWVLTSQKHKGIEEFVELLKNSPEKIEGYYGAALIGGKVERLPCN